MPHLTPLRTSFIGREQDLKNLQEASRQNPLVTVLGPPGMGKTRLSLEFLSRLSQASFFCDLSDVKDVDGFVAAVAAVFSLKREEDLQREMVSRGAFVLVLDNFEQLVPHAPLLSQWLRAAPHAKFIVTSRERLWIPEEQIFDLRPLEDAEAIQLFITRAKAVRSDFTGEPPLLTELVRRLDGIPLALELCASRCRVLALPELLKSLESRFALLSSKFIGLPKRQQTLSQAIDWSWEMLSSDEKLALSQCIVFEGGFTVTAAEHIWNISSDVLDTISSLCDKSLLYRYEAKGDESRFGVYMSIREYAAQKALCDVTELQERHAVYYLNVAEEWEKKQKLQDEVRQKLEREAENLFAIAARFTRDARQLENSLRALWVFSVTGLQGVPPSRFVPLFSPAIEEAKRQKRRDSLFAKCLAQLAVFKSVLKKHQESLDDLQEALSLAESLQEQALVASILYNIGQVMVVLSHPEARQYLERAYKLAINVGDSKAATVTQGYLINKLVNDGELGEAQRLLGELDPTQPTSELIRLWGQSGIALARGRGQEAEALLHEVLGIYERRKYQRGELIGMLQMGAAKLEQGALDESRSCYQKALQLAQQFEETRLEGISLGYLGIVSQLHGDTKSAREHYQRSLSILRQTAEVAYCGLFSGFLGGLLCQSQEEPEGKAYLTSAIQMLSQVSAPLFLQTLRFIAKESKVAPVEISLEARIATKLYLQPPLLQDRPPPEKEESARDEKVLLVEEGGRWFSLPELGKVSLATRKPLGRILRKLAEVRLQKSGEVVSPREMVRAGWPGENLEESSAKNRLYSTIKMLRNLGLRDALLQSEDGYLLDPKLPIQVVAEQ